jgi:protein N-terminal asparagine amidohydrolase
MDLYDTSNGVLRVGPIHYPPSRGIELWLEQVTKHFTCYPNSSDLFVFVGQADDILVAHLSFAPEAELPNFPMKARSALKHIRDHPFPAITIFPDNRPRYFRKDEAGNWIQVRFC